MTFGNGYNANSSGEQPYLRSFNSYYTSSDFPDYSRQAIDQYLIPIESYMNNPIINYDSAINGVDILENILNSKKESLSEAGKSILNQIFERIDLKEKNLYELDDRICRAGSIILQLEAWELGTNGAVDKRIANIEKELIGFEREKRFEQVACWRDISRLKIQLMELKQKLDSQVHRQKLLDG